MVCWMEEFFFFFSEFTFEAKPKSGKCEWMAVCKKESDGVFE